MSRQWRGKEGCGGGIMSVTAGNRARTYIYISLSLTGFVYIADSQKKQEHTSYLTSHRQDWLK